MSVIAGDKLYEAGHIAVKTKDVVEQLEAKVEFPDTRSLINKGKIDFKELLKIRSKAKRFREWLQSEAERDRDAIIAYHEEVAKESGLARAGRKTLKMFGVIGGGAVGGAVGSLAGNPVAGATLGSAAGTGLTYVLELASKIGSEWKPVVFGNWYKERIAKLLSEEDDNPFTTLDI